MAIGREITELQERIGYHFSDLSYLENALTHTSYANEQNRRGIRLPSNERLEFLGDAVLEIAVSEYLYTTYTTCSEGDLTRMRQSVVCKESLARLAADLSLGAYLNVGNGEEEHGLRTRVRVLANAMEAVFAAVYLDAKAKGSDAWRSVILSLLKKETEAQAAALPDAKTRLQELVEKDGSATLSYDVTGECGPEHEKVFTVTVKVNNNAVGEGTAKTKKEAEMIAARAALSLFGIS